MGGYTKEPSIALSALSIWLAVLVSRDIAENLLAVAGDDEAGWLRECNCSPFSPNDDSVVLTFSKEVDFSTPLR